MVNKHSSAKDHEKKEYDDRVGHRQRLRKRFMDAGQEALSDYEMLEMLLFRAIPRRDVKPLAKQLLRIFHDFNGVITAPYNRLKEVKGLGDGAICELKIVQAAACRLAQGKIRDRQVLSRWSFLIDYCRVAFAHLDSEQFRILFLDKKNVLILDEEQQRGTVDHVPVYPREVVKRALELQAVSLILVHNHPSGDPSPSRADVDMTKQIINACATVGITVHDHVIVGRESVVSFRATGLI